jgi:hypothetical protein
MSKNKRRAKARRRKQAEQFNGIKAGDTIISLASGHLYLVCSLHPEDDYAETHLRCVRKGEQSFSHIGVHLRVVDVRKATPLDALAAQAE